MRQYLVGSWNNADNYDYSGEMLLGNRHKGRSICADHVLPDGKANLARYADVEQPKKTKKPIPIGHKIIPQQKTLDKLDQQELELHKAYKNDEVSLDEYEELLYALDQKRERAFKALCKATGRALEDEAVGYDGLEEKTLNWYDKALTKGGFEGNIGGVEAVNKNSLAKDLKILLTGSTIGLIVILTLINV